MNPMLGSQRPEDHAKTKQPYNCFVWRICSQLANGHRPYDHGNTQVRFVIRQPSFSASGKSSGVILAKPFGNQRRLELGANEGEPLEFSLSPKAYMLAKKYIWEGEVSRWHKPNWLYEPLPYAYGVIGLAAALGTGNSIGIVSGIALCSAGAAIWQLRRTYRNTRAVQSSDESLPVIPEGPIESRLVNLLWKPSFNVGHEVIDRQHRRLFEISNDLINSLLTRKLKGDIELLLDELILDIKEHFQSEEEIMMGYNNPISDAHKNIHANLLSRVKQMRERFHSDKLSVSELVGFLTCDVVADHIIKEDLKFGASVRSASILEDALVQKFR